MPTDPLTGSRYPASSAAPNVAQDIQNAVIDLSDNTIPSFTTTTNRNNAWASWVALGNSMRNGLRCITNGQPQIYLAGSWRTDLPRHAGRNYTPAGSGISAGGNRQSGTGADPAITSFTAHYACRLEVTAQFRGGADNNDGSAMMIYALVGGVTVASGVMRYGDVTTTIVGWRDVTAGTHTLALRAEGFGGPVTWHSAVLSVREVAAE